MKTIFRAVALSCFFVFGFASSVHSTDYTFTTICGAPGVYGTTDGTNRNARFGGADGICIDASGRLFVAESMIQVIRMVTPVGSNWVVKTVAGVPWSEGSADGTNNQVRFQRPGGIAVDQAGNLFITDSSDYTVRKMSPVGTDWVVTTIAGLPGVKGSADGTNSSARFYGPYGIATDGDGNLYVADSGNNTIRRITPIGTNWVTTTIAGQPGTWGDTDGPTSTALLSNPKHLTLDSQGHIYFTSRNTVRKLTLQGTNGMLKTIVGVPLETGSADGTNGQARLGWPYGIDVDNLDNLYLTEALNNTVRKITPVGTNYVTTTIGGLALTSGTADGTGAAARFDYPLCLTVGEDGAVYVGDTSNYAVRRGVTGAGFPNNLYPVAQCKTVFVLSDSNGLAHASVDNGSYDPDSDPITISASPASPYPVGTNFVSLTVTDSKGASSFCNATVMVYDSAPPWLALQPDRSAISAVARTGQVVVFQVSTNLVNWTSLRTNTIGSTPAEFDPHASGQSKRFYRLKLWP